MQPPQLVSSAYTIMGASGSSISVGPDSTINIGNWMILVFATLNNTTITTPPSGWTQVEGFTVAGTLATVIWAKQYVAGETTYTIAVGGNGNTSSLFLMWMTGVDDVSTWTIGANQNRANIVPATTFNNVAPGVTPTRINSLVLTVSTERTIATESDITSISNSTEWFFGGQSGTQYESTTIGYYVQPFLSPTNDVTIVYPNTQALNGSAIQLALPPSINLIVTQAIQRASDPTRFTVVSGTASVDTSQALANGSSLRVTPSASGVSPYIYGNTPNQWAPVVASSQYTGVVSAITPTGSFQFQAVLLWYNASSGYLSATTGSPLTTTATAWQLFTVTGTAPAGAAYAVVQLQASSTLNATDYINVDNFGIQSGTNTSWNASAAMFPGFAFAA